MEQACGCSSVRGGGGGRKVRARLCRRHSIQAHSCCRCVCLCDGAAIESSDWWSKLAAAPRCEAEAADARCKIIVSAVGTPSRHLLQVYAAGVFAFATEPPLKAPTDGARLCHRHSIHASAAAGVFAFATKPPLKAQSCTCWTSETRAAAGAREPILAICW